MTKKQLQIYTSLGPENSVGWLRDDLPMIHVFAQALPDAEFKPSNGRGDPHWPCKVCDFHKYTEADFHEQMAKLCAAPLVEA